MKLLLSLILIVLIIHLLFYIKNTNEKIFEKYVKAIFTKEIVIPLFFIFYTLTTNYYFLSEYEKNVIYILVIITYMLNTGLFKVNFKVNMLPFILLTLYKLYIDDNILLSYYLLLLVMFIVIIGYLFYKKNKKLKTSFFIISLNFIFIIFIEYQKDYRVSKNINYIIPIEKFEKDRNFFNNKNIILIEKNGIVKTSRFRIKFNGVAHKVLYNRTNFNFLHKNIYENYYRIKRYDYLISKYYEAGKLKYNIVHFYEFNTIDKLKFLTFLAIRNNNFDKNKYDKIVTYNKNFEEEFNSFIFSYEKKADFYILNNKFLLPLKENLDIYDTNEIIKIVQKMIYSSKK